MFWNIFKIIFYVILAIILTFIFLQLIGLAIGGLVWAIQWVVIKLTNRNKKKVEESRPLSQDEILRNHIRYHNSL